MKKHKCFDIGTIQAFIDGELTSGLSESVIKHIALCDSCALMLAETEEENAFAFSVLDEELNSLVPTERLRTKLFETIREIESEEKSNWWHKITESLGLAEGFSFKSPSLVAFASVVLLISALAIGVNFYKPMPGDIAVINDSPVGTLNVSQPSPADIDLSGNVSPDSDDEIPAADTISPTIAKATKSQGFRIIKTGGINAGREKTGGKAPKPPVSDKVAVKNVELPASPNLTGEDSYLQTIATLNKTVDTNKDLILRPTERVAYERDLAVVDDAIIKMKKEVRKNPKNQAAREVLRASYQNKIDLLNSVAEKTEMIASIQ